jgi:hypothetical protein
MRPQRGSGKIIDAVSGNVGMLDTQQFTSGGIGVYISA